MTSSGPSSVDLARDASPRAAGIGVLEALEKENTISLPLVSVQIEARVVRNISQVTVTQVFRNDHPDPIEAVYTFPLPGAAAISACVMKVAERTIHGVMTEREQARRQFVDALAEGKRASLLEQERDDVFTMQVGNVPSGENVTITITYSECLTLFENGAMEVRLPLVIGLRYIPGTVTEGVRTGDGIEPDTDLVPDASRISPPRLLPGFDPKTNLSIQVELIGDTGTQELTCSQHATRMQSEPGKTIITLAREHELLDRDFVLRWRAAGSSTAPSLVYYQSPDGETFGALSILAPAPDVTARPRDVVFLLDKSGSMMGGKIAAAARACSILLSTLGPADRFALLTFSSDWTWEGDARNPFLNGDQAGIERGQRLLRAVESDGGTELDAALAEALQGLKRLDRTNRIPVVVLITDGEVGDESRILKRTQDERGETRIFTVGIDTAVNTGLLSRLAAVGHGTSAFVEPDAALDAALSSIAREIGAPVVTDLKINGPTRDLAPARVPDLFAGRFVNLFFRAKAAEAITIRGKAANGRPFVVTAPPMLVDMPAVTHLWARAHVRDLEDRFRTATGKDREAVKKEIIAVSLARTVLTRMTAFIAIDDVATVADPSLRQKIVQPVHMPAQWAMAMPAAPPPPSGGLVVEQRLISGVFRSDELMDLDTAPRLAGRASYRHASSSLGRARHEFEDGVANLRRLLEKFVLSAESALLTRVLHAIERLLKVLERQDPDRSKPHLVLQLEEVHQAVKDLLNRRTGFETRLRRMVDELQDEDESTTKPFWERTI